MDGEGSSRRFGHGGDNGEFSANLVAYTTSGQGVVIMTNGVRGGRLINEILRSIAHEYGWPDFRAKEKTIVKVDPKVYADYIGRYRFEFSSDYLLTIIAEGDKLITELKQPTSTSRTEVYPESETKFFRRDVDVEVMFVRDENRSGNALNFSSGQSRFSIDKNSISLDAKWS